MPDWRKGFLTPNDEVGLRRRFRWDLAGGCPFMIDIEIDRDFDLDIDIYMIYIYICVTVFVNPVMILIGMIDARIAMLPPKPK